MSGESRKCLEISFNFRFIFQLRQPTMVDGMGGEVMIHSLPNVTQEYLQEEVYERDRGVLFAYKY